ncbi:DUF4942 domain-containing protein [Methylobacterium oryzae]|uniref:DUF4942 domain-containing protein n=1 Tax=Methylobacterium oryzae TaxID=334852 RepID=UPI002F30C7CD
MENEIAKLRRLSEVVEEYETKKAAIPQTIKDFEAAGVTLREMVCIGGTWGNSQIDTGRVYDRNLEHSLLKSAWRHVYDGLNIKTIASARDRKRFDQTLEDPVPFTLENIRATFGDFLLDPRGNILRGLAEVFCDLDPAYKSHDKVKIGVQGLPKRIILTNVGGYASWGRDRLENVLNALASYQGKPMVSYEEMEAILKVEGALLSAGTVKSYRGGQWTDVETPGRGVRLKRFSNGNGHLFFEPDTLKDINRALAEFYGEVLPDCSEEKPTQKQASTAVSKDLQYYPTPKAVIERVLNTFYQQGERILEPSCGCGRFLDALKAKGAYVFGVEIDAGRAEQCRAKGHNVMIRNFLEMEPTPTFDRVVMNPPFYGTHYAKHVEHALKFLKPGGRLTAILPITAKTDHGLLDHLKGHWDDLPVGSFRESGTNINTTIFTARAPE